MAKLKNIVKQLSEKDFKSIHDSLIESNAEKSAYLMKSLRERSMRIIPFAPGSIRKLKNT